MLKRINLRSAQPCRRLMVYVVGLSLWLMPAVSIAEDSIAAADPLDSPMWREMHQRLLGGQSVVFDDKVRVYAPVSAENSFNVPVKVDATALGDVKRMVVFADLNPIPRILELEPEKSRPTISFNFKVQQATPLRAAAQDNDGVWHVGGVMLDASGGGCTQPSVGSASSDWSAQLGNVSARLWSTERGQRLRFRVMHPMDTGLAPRIPAFFIERLEVSNDRGESLATVHLFEPVAENPTLTLDFGQQQAIALFARDNNGNLVQATVSQGL